MKRIITVLVLLTVAFMPLRAQVPVEGKILVKLVPGACAERLLELPAVTNVSPLMPAIDGRYILLEYDPQLADMDGMLSVAGALDCVESAMPDLKFVVEKPKPSENVLRTPSRSIASDSPDDPLFPEQWGLQAVNMPELWKIPLKDPSWRPVIAVLDDGVDLEHPDLAPNIWINYAELNGLPGVDDDGNGYVDDIHGWNVADGNADLSPNSAHGTHCAGIAAAAADNGTGIAGANPDALIMPVKIFCTHKEDETHEITESSMIWGINYAAASGADVVSMSVSYPVIDSDMSYMYCDLYKDLFATACKDVIMVVSSGNHSLAISEIPCCPPALPSVIGVEASDPDGALAWYSNFDDDGPWFRHDPYGMGLNYELRAPGSAILSTVPGGGYDYLDGTSMAAPLVAGIISRLISVKDYASREELLRDLILSRGTGLGPVDAMKAYAGCGGTAMLQLPYEERLLDAGQSGVTLNDMTVINLSDSALTGLQAVLSIHGSDAAVVNGTCYIGRLEPGEVLPVDETGIGFSISGNAMPGSHISMSLVLKNHGLPVDSAMLHIRLSEKIITPDGLIYEQADSTSLRVIGYEGTDDTLVIPDSVSLGGVMMPVRSIKSYGLAYGSYEHVSLPETLQEIGGSAFLGCMSLVSADIPASVRELGRYVFADCMSLETVRLHDGLEKIAGLAFSGCMSLASIDIPSTVTWIGEYAFEDCMSLSDVTLHDGLKVICSKAFYSCWSLSEITLPATLDSISITAFNDCSDLAAVRSLSVTPPATDYGNGDMYNFDESIVKNYADDFVLPAIETGNEMEVLDVLMMFSDAYGPGATEMLLEICSAQIEAAFGGESMESFREFLLPFMPNVTLYVPEGCADAYREAEWWRSFGDILELAVTGARPAASSGSVSVSDGYRVTPHIVIRDGRKYFVPVYGGR